MPTPPTTPTDQLAPVSTAPVLQGTEPWPCAKCGEPIGLRRAHWLVGASEVICSYCLTEARTSVSARFGVQVVGPSPELERVVVGGSREAVAAYLAQQEAGRG